MKKEMQPRTADRKKFDLDLQYGQIRESQIAEMLENSKIEVSGTLYSSEYR